MVMEMTSSNHAVNLIRDYSEKRLHFKDGGIRNVILRDALIAAPLVVAALLTAPVLAVGALVAVPIFDLAIFGTSSHLRLNNVVVNLSSLDPQDTGYFSRVQQELHNMRTSGDRTAYRNVREAMEEGEPKAVRMMAALEKHGNSVSQGNSVESEWFGERDGARSEFQPPSSEIGELKKK